MDFFLSKTYLKLNLKINVNFNLLFLFKEYKLIIEQCILSVQVKKKNKQTTTTPEVMVVTG